jgi:hypothetical protein
LFACGEKIVFGRSKPHVAKRPLGERSRTLKPCTSDKAPLAQALLELILDRAHLKRLPANAGGIVIVPLESWQIDVLAAFGVVIKNERIDPKAMETMISGPD